jgi:hypothetical protein
MFTKKPILFVSFLLILASCMSSNGSSTSLQSTSQGGSSDVASSLSMATSQPISLSPSSPPPVVKIGQPTIIIDRTAFTFANWDLFTVRTEPIEGASHFLISIKIYHASNSSSDIIENNLRMDESTQYFLISSAYGKNQTGTPFYTKIDISITTKSANLANFLDAEPKNVTYIFNQAENKKIL